ncbi:murein transglycosylase A [Aestuariivirga litoralis]|uniref:murein transglycosylase A n=1 Tax=Aestuariivirga litoralis TaxID=2650924 RepID=UPI0018C589EA|nr:MltA domain-containing protein [Aestuariivirga litoralis]
MTRTEALKPISFDQMTGWAADDHAAALRAFQLSAQEIQEAGSGFRRASSFGGERQDWLPICAAALHAGNARNFFETWFLPLKVHDTARPAGLFTGYYEPELRGSMTLSKDYPVPVYERPPELVAFTDAEARATHLSYGRHVNGKAVPFFSRHDIENGALAGRGLELLYVSSWVDAFFLHVQGSGRVILPDGKVVRLSYAAKNGRGYTGIGSLLLKRGIGTPETMSMQFLRAWMLQHPEQALELLWSNDSFVFFRETQVSDPALGAIGAAKVNLTPLRSLAVDRTIWAFGTPLFVDTHEPPEAEQGAAPFRHLMIAQDTGTAIRGTIRGDVYWGWGANAERNAGHMKSPGGMVALLPKALARRWAP